MCWTNGLSLDKLNAFSNVFFLLLQHRSINLDFIEICIHWAYMHCFVFVYVFSCNDWNEYKNLHSFDYFILRLMLCAASGKKSSHAHVRTHRIKEITCWKMRDFPYLCAASSLSFHVPFTLPFFKSIFPAMPFSKLFWILVCVVHSNRIFKNHLSTWIYSRNMIWCYECLTSHLIIERIILSVTNHHPIHFNQLAQ